MRSDELGAAQALAYKDRNAINAANTLPTVELWMRQIFGKDKALNLNQHDLRRSLRRPLGLISARIFDGFALYGKRSQNFSMLKHILFIPMVM